MTNNIRMSSPFIPLRRGSWFIIPILILLLSCNKEKRFSKKLIKGENWTVENITVDGTSIHSKTTWQVKGDDIYKEVSQVTWSPTSTNSTIFEWQFQDKGKTWILNYLQDCLECDGTMLDDLDYLAYDLSGKYDVVTHKRKEMLFRSSASNKYSGQVVEIKIVKE